MLHTSGKDSSGRESHRLHASSAAGDFDEMMVAVAPSHRMRLSLKT